MLCSISAAIYCFSVAMHGPIPRGKTIDVLVGSLKEREEAEAQAKCVSALREYARLSRLKFDNGYAVYLEVFSLLCRE